MSIWIKNPLVSYDAARGAHRNGGLVVRGNRIAETVPLGGRPSAPVEHSFDASRRVLLPGLINTHHHFYQTLTRALRAALDKPLFPWLQALYPVWAGLTEEMVDAATRLAGYELLLSGCTTTTDHHYLFPSGLERAIDVQADAIGSIGLRAVLTRGSMSLGETDGGLPPDSVVQSNDAILADSERLIERWHDSADDALCQVALAPCSPFSVTPELLRDSAALARRADVLLHTHLAETADEEAFCIEQFGCRPLDHLAACGWLTDRSWFAHGIHFTDQEIARLGASGCGVSHCPSSNMVLASGICPAPALEQAGVAVALGVDGSASNDGSNLIQEVRQAMLIQRLGQSATDTELVSHLDALRWATEGGARLLHRPSLGHLEDGACADLALFDLDEPRFSGSEDPLAALVLCGAHRADAVMVNGEWRVQNGQLTDADLPSLQARHRDLAQALWANH